ncbi:MAG: polymerase protein [Parcubacteria group bacterium GW2011_GWD1_44_9]|nr:MAG: polymerase protein [Parcubacteria group bacterium GW2011_GWC1_43_30]KKT85228.1 MAG: polymerase protein [Parcubacteria group bacterium GW2011_GWD1_44_9]
MKTKKLILFDAHAIIHRAYHALPEFATSSGEPTGALYGLSAMLLKIIGELKPNFMVACFDLPGPTYRHEVYDAYKAGRAKIDDNLVSQLERAKDVFSAFSIPIYSHPGFEADDIIGTIVNDLKKDKNVEVIIASGDMDALQLVDDKQVQVYTLKKGINDTILYDEKKVTERFGFPPKLLVDYKGLRGDPSDNIIGVKGIGEKTATSLITVFGTVEDIYKVLKKKDDTYKKAGINERVKNLLVENEKEALFSKTLATIRTDAPIHFVLPPEWKQTLELNKLLELFSKLEFRIMGERAKRLVGEIGRSPDVPVGVPTDSVGVKELCLALWVIDSNMTSPSLEDVLRFTKAENIKEAKKIIEAELDKRKVRKVFEEIEKPIVRVVEEMNEKGVKIDKKVLKNLSLEYHQELTRLEKAIWKIAGEEFNINSPKILSNILFSKLQLAEKRQKKTPTGALSTKESELEKLRDKHPIIALILEYRELAKLLSTYIDAIPPLLDKNSRLHSTFIQAGTTTGRMASQLPNLQNIPNKTVLGRAIRHAFVAEDGFKLVSFDYSQIELRIAAILSRDRKLIEIFKNGEDVHAGVAMHIFKVPKDLVDKSMRTRAKTINFGILYGMGVNALKTNLGVERKEAQEFYDKYFQTFAGLATYLDKIKAEAGQKGYTETLFGRRRYFEGLKSPLPYVRAQAERMAINAPIQGTQADLIKIAMKRIDEYIKSEKHEDDIRLILQVHDELVYEVKDSLVNEAVKLFKQLMETVLPEDKTFSVPIIAEVSAGDNWGEMRHI